MNFTKGFMHFYFLNFFFLRLGFVLWHIFRVFVVFFLPSSIHKIFSLVSVLRLFFYKSVCKCIKVKVMGQFFLLAHYW